MSLTIQTVAVTSVSRGLKTLASLLDKAKAHAEAAGTDPDAFVTARLFEDMLPLAGQIQRASDTAKASIARLTGIDQPSFPDEEKTLAELHERIAKTLAFVESAPASAFFLKKPYRPKETARVSAIQGSRP